MATTSLNGFDEFFIETHAGMTSVMIHSNRTVSHEVKDNPSMQSRVTRRGRMAKGWWGPY